MKKSDYIGFGFNKDYQNHFYVIIPEDKKSDIRVYERYKWDEDGEQVIRDDDVLKVVISRAKWIAVASSVAREFNKQLKEDGLPCGKFVNGGNPLKKMFGKELMLLLWAIEKCDARDIPRAITNWLGFSPAERWWLYTTTNAATGAVNDSDRGWRVALRYALCGNPV